MVIADKRRNLIVSTSLNYFGVDRKTVDDRDYDNDITLDKFLEEAQCQRICAIFDSESESLEFSSSSIRIEEKNNKKYLVFFKMRDSRVSEENFHEVVQVTSTVSRNSVAAALRQVWTPALPEREALLLKKLEKELTTGGYSAQREAQMLQEEESRILGEAAKRPAKARANYDSAVLYLKNIRRELDQASLAREGLLMVQEVLDSVSGHLDDLWKLSDPIVYDEPSTKRLLDLVASHIARSIKQLIVSKSSSSPTSLGRAKDDALLTGAAICEQWLDMCARMTGLFWPHSDSHNWRDKPYRPPKFEHFKTRLKDIGEIRFQKRQLTRLLTPSEIANLGIDALFESFENLEELLSCDSSLDEMEDDWRKIREQLEAGLEPAEERVAAKLKAQLASSGATALNLETEFRRYSELVARRYIKGKLRPERQSLLGAYPDLVASYQAGLQRAPDVLLDTPEILQSVQAARVAELRLESLEKLGRQLLDDLPTYEEEVSGRLRAAREDAVKLRQELAETWVRQTREAVLSNDLSLDRNDNLLVAVDRRTDKMQVNFDPRLSTLIREARSLSSQGVELPREVRDLVDRAYNLTQRARALQQVANFYNTIGDRMILSQRPIMHTTSLELANAVKESSTSLSWSSNPRSIDAFTARLRELVKKFARQNSELSSKHALLRDLLVNLLKGENNLATNQTAWKDTLRSMREVVNSVEAKYAQTHAQSQHQSTRAWKLHWDRQLLKALGISYRAALPGLLGKLPEVRLELTYRDERLQWQPSLEDARTKIYSGIRRFMVIPSNFRGVDTSAPPEERMFHVLIAQSANLFGPVYAQAEGLLRALDDLRLKWLPLVAPAKLDIGQTLKGKQPQDWEKAFKDAKQWAQEVGKLRANEIRMSCVVVDTGTIRNDLESLSRRFWERLALDLRAEASSRLLSVTDFLSSASKKLSQRARTIDEVGEAFEAYSGIQNQSRDIVQELEDVSGLGRVLAAWTREKLDGLSNAHAAWESLRERLDNYQGVMLHQLEEAKLNLRHQVLAVHDEQERWSAKWADRYSQGGQLSKDWMETMREKWTNLSEQRDSLMSDCKRLNLPVEEIFSSDQKAMETMEAELEAEELNCKLQAEFLEELERLKEEDWSVAKRRLNKIHDWLDSWDSRVKFNKGELDSSSTFIGRQLAELREALESLSILRSDELADEHWGELRDILELSKVKRAGDVTLGHLLPKAGLIRANADRVKEVVRRAAAESGIRQALAELEAWESYTSLPVQEARDSRNKPIHVVGDYSTLLSRAAELKMILDGARGAAGYERFTSRAARCESAITELEERLKVLSQVQRKWVYLEPVYASSAAPNDSGRWSRADKEFRYFMGEIAREPKIPSLKKLSFNSLISLKDLMDRCQKSLDDFLEEKRSAYPRLYFLSDEDLLELVSGKGKGLDVHLSKLYQGVGSVVMTEKDFITGVSSPEGERLELVERVNLKDGFPLWLASLEKVLRDTLQQSLNTCLLEQNPEISSFPTQILLLCERIRFTERCELAMDDDRPAGGLRNLLAQLENRRESLRKLEDKENNVDDEELRSLKAQNLLLETVHHIHIVRNLLSVMGDRDKLAWNWNRQMRTYKNGGGAVVRCGKAELAYRFEYQGAAVGLVRTPLTEKCYLALTQAMKLGLGGSPTGPAGTGKTESVKALGSILGRRVLVFNCDEGMDTGSMRRILSGLAQAGAWGCFDEFNRLEEGTMSAVAMLIRPLQEAIRSGSTRTQLGDKGQEISVDPNCCLFVTMNPAGDDYGGRRKLPDSLARLFRPIGMAHPNKANIVQSLLECSGFGGDARRLAQRCVQAFEAADKLLSKRAHYDWGLRALRSVLSAIPVPSSSKSDPVARVLVGIRESTMPKLVQRDVLLFGSLLNDIFPKASKYKESSTGAKERLRSALTNLCETQGINDPVSLVDRCLQLNDQLKTRSGAAIVGPPGSGKSLIVKTLADAVSKLKESQLKRFHVYPGAVTKSKLLGSVDPQTREFKEGLISKLISNYSDKPLWIVFDGDVDPEWAEALNSVLDDNRILTLPNGVGIKLGNETRFIFETHKLSGASPATVSRLGIVYLGSTSPDTVLKSSSFLKDNSVNSTTTNFVRSHLSPVVERALSTNKDEKSAPGLLTAALAHLTSAQTQTSCAYGLLLALCGQASDPNSREDLARYIYKAADLWCPDSHDPYDVFYDKNKDALDPFLVEARVLRTDEGLVHLSGPVQRGVDAIVPWTRSSQAVIIRGPSGCGKNSLLSAVLTLMKNESDESISVIKGSSVYGSKDLISRLKRSCIKLDSSVGTRTYRPKNGSSLVLVVEDLHLASNNLQELLRQLILEGGFYEDDLEFAKISVSILCTADATTKLHPRLDSLLASHYLSDIRSKDLDEIVKLHLRESLKNFDDGVATAWISKTSSSIVQAFKEVSLFKDERKDVIINWTPRDLIRWISSLKYYPKPEKESLITSYLIDASRRLYRSKLSSKNQKRLEKMLTTSRGSKDKDEEFYVWKGGQNNNAGLTLSSDKLWRSELENAVTKCMREGDSAVPSTVTPHLLDIAAGVSWSLGCEHRGILLSGRPGAGRRSATKLISTISSMKLIDSGPGKGKASLKNAIQSAGIDGESTILLLEEHNLREDELSTLAGAILHNGELLSSLVSPEELSGLIAPLGDLATREEWNSGSLEMFFYHRLKKYLTIVLIVDEQDVKAGDEDSLVVRNSVKITGQNLGSEWWTSEESLIVVASDWIKREHPKDKDEDDSKTIMELVRAHLSAPPHQRAPARFLALLEKWRDVRDEWLRDIGTKLKTLQAGVDKLKEAAERVAKLEEDATKQRQELETLQGRAGSCLYMISN